MFYQVERDVYGLEHLTAHVQAVQGAIGSINEVHRPEPDIGRAHEFVLFFNPFGLEAHTIRQQHAMMNQIVLAVPHKHRAIIVRRIGAAAVDGNSRRCIDDVMACARRFGGALLAGHPSVAANLPPPFDRADAENGDRAGRNIIYSSRDRQVRVAS